MLPLRPAESEFHREGHLDAAQFTIPGLVRVKPGALDRLGIYLARADRRNPCLLVSSGLQGSLTERVRSSLSSEQIAIADWIEVPSNTFELAVELFTRLPPGCDAIVGVGGGKALDVAKYIGFLAGRPYVAVPTSLSNDGFCSPQSSLVMDGQRRSLPARLPTAVVVDTDVCSRAPRVLSLSGVGDLVAKLTALRDWKLAFHAAGEPVDDFAALVSDGVTQAFLHRPQLDAEGYRLLATALLLNGIAMSLCGSSRPASGSEHLVSHALDELSARPRLHGLQVGVASYLISRLQGMNSELIAAVFQATGFWDEIAVDPFSRAEWLAAFRRAPAIKHNFYTILSSRDVLPEVAEQLDQDPLLARCFVA